MTSSAYLEDSSKRLTILSHQAHGVGSLSSGRMDVMLDRKLRQDDNRGLGEAITDNVATPIPLWLLLEHLPKSIKVNPAPALSPVATATWQSRNYPLQQLYSFEDDVKEHPEVAWGEGHHLSLAPLSTTLPEHVQILTLARREVGTELVLRLLVPPSAPFVQEVDLNMFRELKLADLRESSLSLMYEHYMFDQQSASSISISIRPAQIKTFIFNLNVDVEEDTLQTVPTQEHKGVKSRPLPKQEPPKQEETLPKEPFKPEKKPSHRDDPPPKKEPKPNKAYIEEPKLPQQPNGEETPTLYAFSAVFYCSLAALVVFIGLAARQRSKKGSFFGWKQPADESVLKLL